MVVCATVSVGRAVGIAVAVTFVSSWRVCRMMIVSVGATVGDVDDIVPVQ